RTLAARRHHPPQNCTSQVKGSGGRINAIYPGFAYDPTRDKCVGWAGGDTVYTFDPDTKTCTTQVFGGGPGPQNSNGTMGRFRYFAALNVFALVNHFDQNAFTLKLPP